MNIKDVMRSLVALANIALFFFILGVTAKIIWIVLKFGWDALL